MYVASCLRCRYDLAQLPDRAGLRTCPECGHQNPEFTEPALPWRLRRAAGATGVAIAPIAGYLILFELSRNVDSPVCQFLAVFSPVGLVTCGIAGGIGAGMFAAAASAGPGWKSRSETQRGRATLLWIVILAVLMGGVGAVATYFLWIPMASSVLPVC